MGCAAKIASRSEREKKGMEEPSAAPPRQHNYN
jgi:hypothetical protein